MILRAGHHRHWVFVASLVFPAIWLAAHMAARVSGQQAAVAAVWLASFAVTVSFPGASLALLLGHAFFTFTLSDYFGGFLPKGIEWT